MLSSNTKLDLPNMSFEYKISRNSHQSSLFLLIPSLSLYNNRSLLVDFLCFSAYDFIKCKFREFIKWNVTLRVKLFYIVVERVKHKTEAGTVDVK